MFGFVAPNNTASLYRPVSPHRTVESGSKNLDSSSPDKKADEGPDALARHVSMTGQLSCKGRLMCVSVPGPESASSICGVIWCKRVAKPGAMPVRIGGGRCAEALIYRNRHSLLVRLISYASGR